MTIPDNTGELDEALITLAFAAYIDSHAPGYTKLRPNHKEYIVEAKQAINAYALKAALGALPEKPKSDYLSQLQKPSRFVEDDVWKAGYIKGVADTEAALRARFGGTGK